MDLIADLLIYASLFVTVSSAICAVTPTPRDNEFMGKYIYPVLETIALNIGCLLYTSPSPRDGLLSRMPSSA